MVTPTRTPPQTITLTEYASARDLDLDELTEWASTHSPLPEVVGQRDGDPTYRLVDLDVARGGTVTIADFAAEHDLDERQIKMSWPKWHPGSFPPQVGTLKRGRGTFKLFPRIPLELIRLEIEAGLTQAEYAERIGVPVETVRRTWWQRYPELRPEPIGARARTSVYRVSDMDRIRRACQGLPLEVSGASEDLLTWGQVLSYLASAAERTPGAGREAMERRRAQGVWPSGEVGADGVERWRRGEVERVQAELTARGGSV
ncbi:hypothetical protein [Nocardiopsis alba]|uniref:hypothetical protein n=1 Tax=Nocardiopsis alba TaxID=53437 RepID=UPI0033AEE416